MCCEAIMNLAFGKKFGRTGVCITLIPKKNFCDFLNSLSQIAEIVMPCSLQA